MVLRKMSNHKIGQLVRNIGRGKKVKIIKINIFTMSKSNLKCRRTFKWECSKAEALRIHDTKEHYLANKSSLVTEVTKYVVQVLP